MRYDAFYQEIQKMLEEIYLKAGSMQLEQKEFFREVDQKIEENRTFIEEQTADWSAEDWKNLFFYYVENGNPEVDDFRTEAERDMRPGIFARLYPVSYRIAGK